MRRGLKNLFARADVHISRLSSVPFGVQWEHDARFLLGNRRNPTLLDVGANVGQTVKLLASVFHDGRIYSFEPVPSTFAELLKNTAGVAGVECVNEALGAVSGAATITTDRDGQNTLVEEVTSGNTATATVSVSTVDEFCDARSIERVDLLKIDTEGHEVEVIRGARSMLSAGRIDLVLAECDFRHRPNEPHGDSSDPQDLEEHGFAVAGLYSGGVDGSGWVWGDVLMVRDGAANIAAS